MKTSAIIAVLMACASFLSANINSDLEITKCRKIVSDLDFDHSNAVLVKKDLLSGTWSTEERSDEMSLRTFQFNDNGFAQIFDTDRAGYQSFKWVSWNVLDIHDIAYLSLTESNGSESLLIVDQTCDGVILTSVNNDESIKLIYRPLETCDLAKKVEVYLPGEWTNVSILEVEKNSDKTKGFYLGYQFMEDGTFICQYGNKKNRMKESGIWEVSKDGQFLLLNISDKKDPNKYTATKVIRISQVDAHGLILDIVMRSSDVNDFFDSNNKMFAFIK